MSSSVGENLTTFAQGSPRAKETRKVQRVGKSSLAISLPRNWVRQTGVKQGDVVTLSEDSDGALRLEPGYLERTSMKCTINADLSREKELLSRLVTGCYVLGYDTIVVSSKDELLPEQLEEIRRVVKRLRGLEIVELSMKMVTIQSFVDPTRFPVDGLIRRMHVMISSMFDAALNALRKGRPELANEALRIESEVDELYWLIVRQLLLALRHREIGATIGIDSPLHAVGDRVASKTLEEIGDFIENLANEVMRLKEFEIEVDDRMMKRLSKLGDLVQTVFEETVKSLFTRDIRLASKALETAKQAAEEERELTSQIMEGSSDAKVAASLRSIIWSLGQIARYCDIIGEITVNRFLRQSSNILTIEGT